MTIKQPLSLLCSAALALGAAPAISPVLAQDEAPAAAVPERPESPMDGGPAHAAQWTNPAFAEIAGMLAGSWKSTAAIGEFDADGSTETVITFAPVPLDGLSDAMYVEAASADALHRPYHQAILQFWARGDQVRLRTLELKDASRNESMVAMWAAPAYFPAFESGQLRGTMDLTLRREGNGWAGATAAPYPVNERGAVEMTSEMRIQPGSLELADRFYDMAGSIVSGPAEGSSYGFARFDHPFRLEPVTDGVYRIMMVDRDAGQGIQDGDQVGFHYWGSLIDGEDPGLLFDSSTLPGRSVLRYQTPGRLIEGWKAAIMGLQADEWVRLLVRGDQAYGPRIAAGGRIPAWADLLFTIHTQYVRTPEPPPAPAQAPAGPAPEQPASEAASDGEDDG